MMISWRIYMLDKWKKPKRRYRRGKPKSPRSKILAWKDQSGNQWYKFKAKDIDMLYPVMVEQSKEI